MDTQAVSGRWYKRCGADFIHGTMMLTLEEKGAYSLCLDLIYDRGGPIPDDARWLSGVCGVSIRKWNSIRARLIELGKLASGHDMLSNARADLELVSAALSSRERAESGAKGGRKRAANAATPKEINGIAQAELKPIEEIREEKIISEPNGSSPALSPEHVLETWNEVAERSGFPKARLTPARRKQCQARIRGSPDAVKDFTAAFSALERSAFLRGENDRGWRADIDFFLQPKSFNKLIEGSYDH